jgi:Big-like domain-containing protein
MATVTDTAGAGATIPTGTVTFSSSGGLFLLGATCSLNAAGSCSVSYTPSLLGSSTVTGSYGGDGRHVGSSGSGTVTSVLGLF